MTATHDQGLRGLERGPKGDKTRVVDMDADVVEAPRVHRKLQLEVRLFLGEAWEDTGYVFRHQNGERVHPQSLRLMLAAVAKRAGLPDLRLHELRHTPRR